MDASVGDAVNLRSDRRAACGAWASVCPGRSSSALAGPSRHPSCRAGTATPSGSASPVASMLRSGLDNDVNPLALGECCSGIAVGHDDVLVIKVGHGHRGGHHLGRPHPPRRPRQRRRCRAHAGCERFLRDFLSPTNGHDANQEGGTSGGGVTFRSSVIRAPGVAPERLRARLSSLPSRGVVGKRKPGRGTSSKTPRAHHALVQMM
jgi:hypothetical protein